MSPKKNIVGVVEDMQPMNVEADFPTLIDAVILVTLGFIQPYLYISKSTDTEWKMFKIGSGYLGMATNCTGHLKRNR
jgi:hypothetical protein